MFIPKKTLVALRKTIQNFINWLKIVFWGFWSSRNSKTSWKFWYPRFKKLLMTQIVFSRHNHQFIQKSWVWEQNSLCFEISRLQTCRLWPWSSWFDSQSLFQLRILHVELRICKRSFGPVWTPSSWISPEHAEFDHRWEWI